MRGTTANTHEYTLFPKAQRVLRLCVATSITLLLLTACASETPQHNKLPQPSGSATASSPSSGTTFERVFHTAEFSQQSAQTDGVNFIDTSHVNEGYFGATASSEGRLKLQVACGEMSYNYDLPGNGTPIIVPANMGSGTYTARIMQNTTADRYVELFSTTCEVTLSSETDPFVRPNVYCNYSQNSECVKLANELCANAANESTVFDAIYDYIYQNISYDYDKASKLATVTGYVPNPDETLSSGSGICFDYASLFAAMLRSQGVPTKILTGYVSPDNVYHAWDMIYIDGSWASLHISASPGQWARADMTFAANGGGSSIGDASAYADRYTY